MNADVHRLFSPHLSAPISSRCSLRGCEKVWQGLSMSTRGGHNSHKDILCKWLSTISLITAYGYLRNFYRLCIFNRNYKFMYADGYFTKKSILWLTVHTVKSAEADYISAGRVIMWLFWTRQSERKRIWEGSKPSRATLVSSIWSCAPALHQQSIQTQATNTARLLSIMLAPLLHTTHKSPQT